MFTRQLSGYVVSQTQIYINGAGNNYIKKNNNITLYYPGRLHVLSCSAVGHKSIAPGFKLCMGYVSRVFHLSLRLITFGGRSAHLAYLVRISGHKTFTFTQYYPP